MAKETTQYLTAGASGHDDGSGNVAKTMARVMETPILAKREGQRVAQEGSEHQCYPSCRRLR